MGYSGTILFPSHHTEIILAFRYIYYFDRCLVIIKMSEWILYELKFRYNFTECSEKMVS